MKIFKRLIIFWMVMIMSIGLFGCVGGSEFKAEVAPLSYTKPVAVTDMDTWQ